MAVVITAVGNHGVVRRRRSCVHYGHLRSFVHMTTAQPQPRHDPTASTSPYYDGHHYVLQDMAPTIGRIAYSYTYRSTVMATIIALDATASTAAIAAQLKI